MNNRERFLELQSVLTAHEALWRPLPFYVRRPDWCAHWPALTDDILGLDEALLEQFTGDPEASLAWLGERLPVARQLAALCDVPRLPPRALAPCDVHFDWKVPGRKREQIDAFAAHAEAHFAQENAWMDLDGFPARDCHVDEHDKVLHAELVPEIGDEPNYAAALAALQ